MAKVSTKKMKNVMTISFRISCRLLFTMENATAAGSNNERTCNGKSFDKDKDNHYKMQSKDNRKNL